MSTLKSDSMIPKTSKLSGPTILKDTTLRQRRSYRTSLVSFTAVHTWTTVCSIFLSSTDSMESSATLISMKQLELMTQQGQLTTSRIHWWVLHSQKTIISSWTCTTLKRHTSIHLPTRSCTKRFSRSLSSPAWTQSFKETSQSAPSTIATVTLHMSSIGKDKRVLLIMRTMMKCMNNSSQSMT